MLARPLRARGSLPLRPLRRHLLSFLLRVIDFTVLVEGHLTFGRQIDGIPSRAPRSAAPDTRPRRHDKMY